MELDTKVPHVSESSTWNSQDILILKKLVNTTLASVGSLTLLKYDNPYVKTAKKGSYIRQFWRITNTARREN